ncbi:cellulase family glycosylhydrolase [Nocardioides acrostichi]|uniref:Cellulase family glycosylhydrolase n=1 Tax=Nocardioides acrostichi TaxID=2784339 RepID=A0A930V144_9ACTN|nr:cellulase family glycosylhydrolase [Nocardioides acrostichi]MBF4162119.1 cellulase family glycosylhydrolase [Nocardioides acrostichi]
MHRHLLFARPARLALAVAGALTLAATVLPAASADATGTGDTGQGARAAAKTGVFVRGKQVRHWNGDGTSSYRFKTRGVIVEGFQWPVEAMQACEKKAGLGHKGTDKADRFCERHLDAIDYFDHTGDYAEDSLTAMQRARRHWKANTVRFNLSQAMLDPASTLYKKTLSGSSTTWGQTYMQRLVAAVHEAEANGMVVILAVFNHRNAQAGLVTVDGKTLLSYDAKSGLPTNRTARAVSTLGERFGSDKEVLIDLYNEPFTQKGQTVTTYVNGDQKSTPRISGINRLAEKARDAGVTTPLITQWADLSQLPVGKITDENMIFSSHPFLGDGVRTGGGDANWRRRFGDLARTRPVVLTAWNATPLVKHKNGKTTNTWCRHSGIDLADQFVKYVRRNDVGLVGFAFDVNQSMIKNFARFRDQPYGLTSCTKRGGAGVVIKRMFVNQAKG